MDTIIFATNNLHKVEEVRAVLGKRFNIITLKEAGIDIDIPEPHDTLEANATEKSKTIYEITNKNCFSEDTGLEVEALHGEPGIKTGSYPKPLFPLRSLIILPGQMPSKKNSLPSRISEITVLKLAVLRLVKSFSILSSKLLLSPAYLALFTPGSPCSASTSRPVSSLKQFLFVIS